MKNSIRKDLKIKKGDESYDLTISVSLPEKSGKDFKTKSTIIIDGEVIFDKYFYGIDEWQSFLISLNSLKARFSSLVVAKKYQVFQTYNTADELQAEDIFNIG